MSGSIWETCMLVPGFSRAECASWVQAWGSVGAILVAAAVVFVQNRLQRDRENRQRIETLVARMRTLQEIGESTAANIAYCQKAFTSRPDVTGIAEGAQPFPPDALRMLPDAVAAIPLHELDSPAMVFEVRTLTILARQVQARIQWMLTNHRQIDAEGFTNTFRLLASFSEQAGAAVARIRRHVDEVERSGRLPLEVTREQLREGRSARAMAGEEPEDK